MVDALMGSPFYNNWRRGSSENRIEASTPMLPKTPTTSTGGQQRPQSIAIAEFMSEMGWNRKKEAAMTKEGVVEVVVENLSDDGLIRGEAASTSKTVTNDTTANNGVEQDEINMNLSKAKQEDG